jgi:VanZ family protein
VVRALRRPAFWALLAVCSLFALVPSVPDQVAQLGDLVLHAGAFLTLAVSGALAYSRRPLWVIGAWLVFYGALIEVVQGMSGLRQADPVDLLVDIVATAVGLAVVAAGRAFRVRWRSRPSG